MHPRAAAIVLTIAATACVSDDAAQENEPSPLPQAAQSAEPGLAPVASCEVLGQSLRARLIAAMHARLESARRSFATQPPWACVRDAGVSSAGSTPRGSSPGVPARPSAVSKTNNQVAGVDEADLVKTADGFLYVLGADALHVLEAWPASATREVARVPLRGAPRQLLVEQGRALVYSALGGRGTAACTYGYDCDFVGDGSRTHVTVLDVQVPSQPRVVRELDLSGSLIAARRIGRAVHTVVAEPDSSIAVPSTPPGFSACGVQRSPEDIDAAFAELARTNEATIRTADLATLLPTVTDTAAPNAGLDCSGFVAASKPSGGSFLSVVSLDLTREAPHARTTLIGRPGAVYVSGESLYVAVRDGNGGSLETSTVHRFRVGDDPALTRYEASGVVPGHVLNQFAMDEWQGRLRIATTSGWVPDPKVHSTFSVLAQRGDALEVVGQVGQIAPGEDIRSVRFAGERGYVVTFKKTDPLFVLDLAVPSAPKVLGELKIPGFSTYMQALDDGHLLTIGYDSDDQGSFAYFQGVLLQIFDVSNPQQPSLLHKTVIGTRGSSSEALTNHLAFNYFAERKLLAVPMTICDGGQSGSFGTRMTFSGLMLFDVDLKTGILERGRVAHPPLATGAYDDASCNNWWTNATSNVKRSVFMDDYVYSIAQEVVRVQALGELGRDVATVPLVASGQATPRR